MDRKRVVGAQGVAPDSDCNDLDPRCGSDGAIEAQREFSAAPAPARRRHIYFITDGEAVKIGVAGDVEGRLTNLQCGQRERLRLLASFIGDTNDERVVHGHFAHLHVRGEWFKLTDEITDFIAGLEAARHLIASRQATVSDAAYGNLRRLVMLDSLPERRAAYMKWFKSNPQEFADPAIARQADWCRLEIDILANNRRQRLPDSIWEATRDSFAKLALMIEAHRAQ